MRHPKSLIVIIMLNLFPTFWVFSEEVDNINIYVSLSGTVDGEGSLQDPVSSISNALSLARSIKNNPVNILIREGTYFINQAIDINHLDNRLEQYPLTISAYKSEEVIISGSKVLPFWNKVIDSSILERLPVESRHNVYVTNLREYGISDFDLIYGDGVALYFNDKKMQIARFPNHGNLEIEELVEPNTKVVRGYKGSETGKFYYKGSFPERWRHEQNILTSGYWFWDWKEQIQEVENIDTRNKIITLKKPYHYYGYRKGQEYYTFNILAELDVADEWYLDRNTGKLYFYPDEEITKNNAPHLATTQDLVELNDVSNIHIKNLKLAYAKNDAIRIQGGRNNTIEKLEIKHIGNQAVTIRNSNNSRIISSHIYSIGAGGVIIKGGDRNKLLSSNICAIGNKIHDYAKTIKTYKAAISLGGVGNCAMNNEIFDAPHIAIYFQGNNHKIEYNNIHDVVKKSNDAGAIYAGRDWTSRGTVIKSNYLHNIRGFKKHGAKGIYLDDEFSGVTVEANIFDGVYDAIFIGGGRDNIIDSNLFINSYRSIYIDDRGVNWAKGQLSQLTNKLNNVPHTSKIWQDKYPKLSNVLTLNPRLPDGNIVKNNVFYDEKWNYVFDKAKPFVTFENNHHLPASLPSKNYQIKTPLKGFSNIPFKKIGVK